MRNLIYKEMKLVLSPFVFLFPVLTALLLVPSWPYAVAMMYFFFAAQSIFYNANSNKDAEFTAVLPVPRNAVVMSKHFTVVFLEMLFIIAAVPFALISALLVNTSGNPLSLDANFAFFGVTLIGYSVFNMVFLPGFFKTGYRVGFPLVMAVLAHFLTVLVLELLIGFVPALKANLDSLEPGTFGWQILLLVAGMIIYVAALFYSYKRSVKNFDKVNM